MSAIDRFDGQHRWLSNFWPAAVMLDGVQYPSVENAYQAAKTIIAAERVPFQSCSAGQAKRLGRRVTMRADWNKVKLQVMRALLTQKFAHPQLRQQLIATGNAQLIEGNYWRDTYWGVCNGVGSNHLGKLLMEIRAEIVR